MTGKNPLLNIAVELERIALQDEYFVSRKLYPNVDFYSGLIYEAMKFPVTMFPVLFAIPRTAGWIAQWEEMILDAEQKIARPTPDLHRFEAARLRPAQQRSSRCRVRRCDCAMVRRCGGALAARRASSSPAARDAVAPQTEPAPVKFDSARAYEHLRRQVGFGPRPAGSAALTQTRQYILAELKTAGIQAREDAWDATTPLGRVRMVNVIATIPGRRPERIALATHYDTKLVREFRFVGASDAASSTAGVLELGRVLKGAAERIHHRAAVLRRRGSRRRVVPRTTTTPTAAATTSRRPRRPERSPVSRR